MSAQTPLELADFSSRVGEQITVQVEGEEPVSLRITEVQELGTTGGSRFSVFLHGTGGRFLPQGTYQVSVDGSRVDDLFLVPIAATDGGHGYEMAFNREGG